MDSYGDKYKVYLKNGKMIMIWFIGEQLEKIFKDYNVKYERIKKEVNKDERI